MKKILVIEDEAESREMFLECLKEEGFCAIGAANGRVGVQIAQEQLPNLVICDIKMPELNGYQVLNTLRQNPATAKIPLIFVSAGTSDVERRYGIELGANDYLIKPCTADDLVTAIAKIC
ncbi:response regulator [Scytonema sp. UIC 10036]|uniref:response regulator n=1 Tax=Scytonema sp. UIC 10036 TaxID=2304196 RepID=UPI0012DACE31|nr:response regulator [Scytonema sp. UIC 10036]MUG97839.1 response regulator [Scytonema sp. UIC 10036]